MQINPGEARYLRLVSLSAETDGEVCIYLEDWNGEVNTINRKKEKGVERGSVIKAIGIGREAKRRKGP